MKSETTNNFNIYQQKYYRRKERFEQILSETNTKPTIFFRLQEEPNRIIYPEYKDKFDKKEYVYIEEFSQHINLINQKLKFMIIYLTKTENEHYDSINKILYLNIKKYSLDDWNVSHHIIKNIFLDKYEFVSNIINEFF